MLSKQELVQKSIYMDAAASALKPKAVIDAQLDFLQNNYSNAGRGICRRAALADDMVSSARKSVADFINADSESIIFTSGATDGLNRITSILDKSGFIKPDTIALVSDLDHHSARLPWQELSRLGKCKLNVCPLDTDFNLDLSTVTGVDIFVITAMSNVLGIAGDVKKIIADAKKINPNVITIVDAAQYVAHLQIDVQNWNADFVCFSAHKIGADTGLGIMYVQEPMRWSVDKFGGGMVLSVGGLNEWVLASGPNRFEAGTLPLTQLSGLPAALTDIKNSRLHNKNLTLYLYDELSKIPRVKILSPKNAAVVTFIVDNMHAFDFGALLGAYGVCARVGNMCASWLHLRFGINGTIRLSPGSWNTMDEAQRVIEIIKSIIK